VRLIRFDGLDLADKVHGLFSGIDIWPRYHDLNHQLGFQGSPESGPIPVRDYRYPAAGLKMRYPTP